MGVNSILYLFYSLWFFIGSFLSALWSVCTLGVAGCYSPYLLIFPQYDTFLGLDFGSSDHY